MGRVGSSGTSMYRGYYTSTVYVRRQRTRTSPRSEYVRLSVAESFVYPAQVL